MTKKDWDKILIEYVLKHPERYLGEEVANLVAKYKMSLQKQLDK